MRCSTCGLEPDDHQRPGTNCSNMNVMRFPICPGCNIPRLYETPRCNDPHCDICHPKSKR